MEPNAYASEQVRSAVQAYLKARTNHTWTLADKGWLMDDPIESYSQARELADDWSQKIGMCSVVMPALGTFVYRILHSGTFTLPQSEESRTNTRAGHIAPSEDEGRKPGQMILKPSPYDLTMAQWPEQLYPPPDSGISHQPGIPSEDWRIPEMAGKRFSYPPLRNQQERAQRVGRVGMVRFHTAAEAKAFLEGVYWCKPLFIKLVELLHVFQVQAVQSQHWTRSDTGEWLYRELQLAETAPGCWLAEWANHVEDTPDGKNA